MRAGFAGLGNLGKAVAGRLIDAEVNLTVWNRTPGKAAGLRAQQADTPAELTGLDVIFLCLFDSEAVEEVLTGEGGLLEGDLSGKVIVDLSTNHFLEAEGFHDLVAGLGGSYLEAPVVGSIVPASKGLLTILVSGDRDIFQNILPLLEILGKNIFYLGEPGLASRMKLVNNLVLGSFMAALAEALSLGIAAGLDKERVLEVLEAGAGNSMVLTAKKGKLLDEDFSPHFAVSAIFKDLHYTQDLARYLGRPLFTGSIAKELFGMGVARGFENEDFCSVFKVLK